MTKSIAHPKPFSDTLESWLKSGKDKSMAGLINVSAEKSFAIIFLLLMALPALPIPTGGITHVTEVIVMLVCLELIVGRQTIWLPARWLKINVGSHISKQAADKLLKIIRWFERFSRRRGGGSLTQRWMRSLIGFVILVFTIAAFVAPPFSGLDTLPALGVVIISLAVILEDLAIVLAGLAVGISGIALEVAAGTAVYRGLLHFF